MSETISDWSDLRLFLAVAQEGGLAAAARVTGRSSATLGRRMLALERGMGRDLFIRHDRGYDLTVDGRKLLNDLRQVEVSITRATAPVTDAGCPLVKISAGTWTTLALLGQITKITGTPADIRLRFLSIEAVLDIAHRETMIGFRNQRPSQTGLAGRKIARVEFAPYASAGASDRWIKVLADTPSAIWLDRTIGNDAIYEVNAPRNSLDLALAGQGRALLPTFVGDEQPALERCGDTVPELAHDQWIVTHQDDRHLPEVRRAIDRLCEIFARKT